MMALEKGLSLNEYEFSSIDGGRRIACPDGRTSSRRSACRIAPELRRTRRDPAASRIELPRLVELERSQGRSSRSYTWSDAPIRSTRWSERREVGLGVRRISDHTKAAFYAKVRRGAGQAQREEIEKAREKYEKKIRIFHGVEANLPTGRSTSTEETLASLDS